LTQIQLKLLKKKLSSDKINQEPLHDDKKEKPVDEREKLFQSFVNKESSSSNEINKAQDELPNFAQTAISNAIKSGGSVFINIQTGGVHVDGNLNNSGHVSGGDQTNHKINISGTSLKEQVDNSNEIDYSSIPLDERVAYWFKNHPAIYHRSLMISMAFLNGSDLKSVIALSEKIEFELRKKSGKDDQQLENESIDFRVLGFRKRLKFVLASTNVGYENKEFGRTTLDIAFFNDLDFQGAVINYIWCEEDYYWRMILECLLKFDFAQGSQTKVHLAAALSESCKYRFDLVREIILLPWAKSDDSSSRSLAALCLSIAALGDHEISSKQSRSLLSHWITLKNSSNLRSTSIEAYSLYIGLKFTDDVFNEFLRVVKSNDPSLLLEILEGIVILFDKNEATLDNQLVILKNLESWFRYHKKDSSHEIAALATWGIMKTVETETNEFRCKILPTLFWLSKTNEDIAPIISSLIRSSMNLKMTRPLILKELKFWFDCVDKDPELRQPLGKIITRIAQYGDSRERLRLKDYLTRWSNQNIEYASKMLIFLQKKSLLE
jgi:hypothetical protein